MPKPKKKKKGKEVNETRERKGPGSRMGSPIPNQTPTPGMLLVKKIVMR